MKITLATIAFCLLTLLATATTSAQIAPQENEYQLLPPNPLLNDTITYSQYDPDSDLVTAELTSDGTSIYNRKFFQYNTDGQITAITIDDGANIEASDLTGVHYRYETTFTYSNGLLNEIKENRLSLETNEYYCLKHLINTYDAEGQHISQHILPASKKTRPLHLAKNASFHTIHDAWDTLVHGIFNKSYLQFSGYYQGETTSGIYKPDNEMHNRVRITLINGILNLSTDMENILEKISKTHGNITVHYVFRPTEGWTKDLFNCTLIKFGYVSQPARLLAKKWKELIKEMGGANSGGIILHYAHSIGATDTYTAKDLLSPQEQAMIHVVTLGSPSMIPEGTGFGSVSNYASRRDPVCLLDPIGYLRGLTEFESNVYFIGSSWGWPEHTMYAHSYNETLKLLGQQFVDQHKEKEAG